MMTWQPDPDWKTRNRESRRYERMSEEFDIHAYEQEILGHTPKSVRFDDYKEQRTFTFNQYFYGDHAELREVKEKIYKREPKPFKWKKITILNSDGTQTVYQLKGALCAPESERDNGNTSRAEAQSEW